MPPVIGLSIQYLVLGLVEQRHYWAGLPRSQLLAQRTARQGCKSTPYIALTASSNAEQPICEMSSLLGSKQYLVQGNHNAPNQLVDAHGTDSETQQVETKNGFQRGRLGRQIELLSYDESPSIGNRIGFILDGVAFQVGSQVIPCCKGILEIDGTYRCSNSKN